MTKEEKQLLLIDLCERLPYGVKVENTSFSEPQIQTLFGRVSDDEFIMLETYKSVGGKDYRKVTDNVHYTGYLERIKPYLRPMSSMTEEEREDWYRQSKVDYDCEFKPEPTLLLENCHLSVDWLNKKRFDYRGLIPMGIALEAEEGMYV